MQTVTHLFELLRQKVAAETGRPVSRVPALTNDTLGETNQGRGTIEVWTPQPLPAAPTCITGVGVVTHFHAIHR